MHPNNRLPTILLAVGAAVLILAVAIGERMGDRVIGQATDRTLQSATGVVTPEPDATNGPYGPDWKRSQALTAAGDPALPRSARPAPAAAHPAGDADPRADRTADADAESEHPDLAPAALAHRDAVGPSALRRAIPGRATVRFLPA